MKFGSPPPTNLVFFVVWATSTAAQYIGNYAQQQRIQAERQRRDAEEAQGAEEHRRYLAAQNNRLAALQQQAQEERQHHAEQVERARLEAQQANRDREAAQQRHDEEVAQQELRRREEQDAILAATRAQTEENRRQYDIQLAFLASEAEMAKQQLDQAQERQAAELRRQETERQHRDAEAAEEQIAYRAERIAHEDRLEEAHRRQVEGLAGMRAALQQSNEALEQQVHTLRQQVQEDEAKAAEVVDELRHKNAMLEARFDSLMMNMESLMIANNMNLDKFPSTSRLALPAPSVDTAATAAVVEPLQEKGQLQPQDHVQSDVDLDLPRPGQRQDRDENTTQFGDQSETESDYVMPSASSAMPRIPASVSSVDTNETGWQCAPSVDGASEGGW